MKNKIIPWNKKTLNEKEIVDLYLNKKVSGPKLARKYKCNLSVINRILKENNVKMFEGGYFNKGSKHSEEERRKMSKFQSSWWKDEANQEAVKKRRKKIWIKKNLLK